MPSITSNFVLGNRERPDIIHYRYDVNLLHHAIHPLNKMGKIPIVSTFTGGARALFSTAHTIYHLAAALFDKKNKPTHLKEAKLGGKNIARGIVEMVPVLGNITMHIVDTIRVKRFFKETEVWGRVEKEGFITMYHCGVLSHNTKIEDIEDTVSSTNFKKVSNWNFQSFLRKHEWIHPHLKKN